MTKPETLSFAKLETAAQSFGFDKVGVAKAEPNHEDRVHLEQWLASGFQASMQWMEKRPQLRTDPRELLTGCQSVIALATFYPAETANPRPRSGKIARYARGRDYHKSLRTQAKKLAAWLEAQAGGETRICVDTTPILERAWAERSGIGWIGKNTNLLIEGRGSWLLLTEILTTARVEVQKVGHEDRCGTCTACLEACPTDAFPEPFVLDASRCLAYWNIEHRGPIDTQFADQFEGWLFGCDICQEVCPWNERFASTSEHNAFEPREGLEVLDLLETLELTEQEFRKRYSGTPLMRAKWQGMRRNAALLLAGEPGDEVTQALRSAASDPDEGVATAASWALNQRN